MGSLEGFPIALPSIREDLYNLAASLDKIELFYKLYKQEGRNDYRRHVSTELEYIFSTCRSVFDLLQKVALTLWKRIYLTDKTVQKRNLPDSFAKMVLKGDTLLTKLDVENIYKVPAQIAKFYSLQGEFFKWLRDYRDKIGHHGKGIEFVIFSEKGIVVSINREPFSVLKIWNSQNTQPNNLGSVKSVVGHIIINTLQALEDFAVLMQNTIQFPEDIAPRYKVFVRSEFSYRLVRLDKWIYEEPWSS